MKPLQRTYFDVTADRNPRFVAAIDDRIEKIGSIDWPLNSEQLREFGGSDDIDAELQAGAETRRVDDAHGPNAA